MLSLPEGLELEQRWVSNIYSNVKREEVFEMFVSTGNLKGQSFFALSILQPYCFPFSSKTLNFFLNRTEESFVII